MPSYQNVTPPISLMPGDVGFSFNNEAFPGARKRAASLQSPVTPGNQILALPCAGRRSSALHRPR
jgi:hypothetical protein